MVGFFLKKNGGVFFFSRVWRQSWFFLEIFIWWIYYSVKFAEKKKRYSEKLHTNKIKIATDKYTDICKCWLQYKSNIKRLWTRRVKYTKKNYFNFIMAKKTNFFNFFKKKSKPFFFRISSNPPKNWRKKKTLGSKFSPLFKFQKSYFRFGGVSRTQLLRGVCFYATLTNQTFKPLLRCEKSMIEKKNLEKIFVVANPEAM